MSFAFPNRQAAEDAATKWTRERKGTPYVGAAGRTISRYIVAKYANPQGAEYDFDGNGRYDWGVVERWTYDDRPDLGEFGGAFVFHVEA
jgi:hypothetical protein